MRSLKSLSRPELEHIVREMVLAIWSESQDDVNCEWFNPDRAWGTDEIEAVAGALEKYDLKPPTMEPGQQAHDFLHAWCEDAQEKFTMVVNSRQILPGEKVLAFSSIDHSAHGNIVLVDTQKAYREWVTGLVYLMPGETVDVVEWVDGCYHIDMMDARKCFIARSKGEPCPR